MSNLVITEAIDSNPRKRPYEKSTKGFRLNSMQVFLTYPQCDVEPELLLSFLKGKYNVEKYIISQEKHEDGNPHIHCYLKMDKQLNIRNDRAFDYTSGETVFHPNIQSCKSVMKVIAYVVKDNKYITNMDKSIIEKALDSNLKTREIYQQAREEAVKGNMDSALTILTNEKVARDMTIHGTAIIRNLRGLLPSKIDLEFPISEFVCNFEWDRSKLLILHGPTNTGKTSLAAALLPKALFVRHIDRLKDYDSIKYEGIIFDDMSFRHMPREGQIHICDTKFESDIHVRYGVANIPKYTPRILTTNLAPDYVILYDDPAIERRCQAVEITEKCYREKCDDVTNEFTIDDVLDCLRD